MEKKLYIAPELSVMTLKESLCQGLQYSLHSEATTDQWSKGQDFDDDEDFDDSPWEE